MNILTEYPFWLIIFCVLAGFAYSFVLYRKDASLNEINIWLLRLMALFRFLVISFLSFFLLSPFIKTVNRNVEKPVIIVAQDNSESVTAGKDSNYYRKDYKLSLQKFIEELSDKYEVRTYSFADKVREMKSTDSLFFKEKQTDVSALFDEIDTRFSNRNVGAVILATDGLYNKGTNPSYSSERIKAPMYTIALGDTTVKKDLILAKVNTNRLAYLGNKFPLEIIVNAKRFKGKSSELTVTKGNATLFSQTVDLTSDAFNTSIAVLLDAKEVGLQHYKVKLSGLPEEMTLSNNEQDVFIDVLDARQKVLILADAPHPDVAALKESIESNQNYEVESYTADNFTKPLKSYNLIILYQIPNTRNPATKLLSEINAANIPVWAFSGANTILKNNLSFVHVNQKSNECETSIDANFPLFTISDELRKSIKNFPAVTCPFGSYGSENSSNVLIYQRIGIVDTKTPFLYFNTVGDNKMAIVEGEGIWRWRLQDYAVHENHNLFDELISKTVQYLSVKVDKSFFKVTCKNNFPENESIEMESEVYNESYELINQPEVNIIITNSDNKTFPFTFSKTANAYRLNAGMMPVGDYKYEAKVKAGEKMYTQRGTFSVSALKMEMVNTVADHQLLYSLAKKHAGEMVYPNDMQKLVKDLNNREDIKSVSYSEKKLTDIINVKWVFFFLLSLLSFEWFFRKRNGSN